MALYAMTNAVQNYAWGNRTMLPALTGRTATENPEAELWMGTHPRSPSLVEIPGRGEVSLLRIAGEDPEGVIGDRAPALLPPGETTPGLPYLFKVLTAEQGLSIQAHPSRDQARAGFERENAAGVPLDAPNRTYKDRNHKPEMIYALEDFWGMRGFRPFSELVDEITRWTAALPRSLQELRDGMVSFVKSPDEAHWRSVMERLIAAGEVPERRADLARATLEYAQSRRMTDAADRDDRYWWVGELLRQFPGDPGAAAPLYLNLVHLTPGEAMYLDAQILHAYLYGAGVEIMANSDNVLRSGCTVKYVDGEELLGVLTFEGGSPEVLRGRGEADGVARRFVTPAVEFELIVVDAPCELAIHGAPTILLALGGTVLVREEDALGGRNRGDAGNPDDTDAAGEYRLEPGRSLFAPAATTGGLMVEPEDGARLFVASIPDGVRVAPR